MTWTTFHLRVTTPLFSGDDPTGSGQPIRVPSIRGALRFWFRAVAGERDITDLPTIARWESEVFGAGSQPSPVQLRISRQIGDFYRSEEPEPTWATREENGFRGAGYLLGQGLWKPRRNTRQGWVGGLTRPHVEPGATFDLQARLSGNEAIDHRFMAAVRSWLLYGGLGARTRRGFGRLACDDVTNLRVPGWTADMLTLTGDPETVADRWIDPLPPDIQDLLDTALPVPEQPADTPRFARFPSFPSFAHEHWDGQQLTPGALDLDMALHRLGVTWRRFRTRLDPHEPLTNASPEWNSTIVGNSHDYPVAALGLPVNYFQRNESGPDRKGTVDLRINGKQEPLRRASPIWLVPFAVGKRYLMLTHIFKSELLPHDSKLKLTGRGLTTKSLNNPSDQNITDTWTAWINGDNRPAP